MTTSTSNNNINNNNITMPVKTLKHDHSILISSLSNVIIINTYCSHSNILLILILVYRLICILVVLYNSTLFSTNSIE